MNTTDNQSVGCTTTLIAILVGIFLIVFFEQISRAIEVISFWFGIAMVVLACGGLVWLVVVSVKRVQDTMYRRAETHILHEQAMIHHKDSRIVTNGEQTFLLDWERNEVEALHLDPRYRHNSKYTEATLTEKQTWLVFHTKNRPVAEQLLNSQPEITIQKPSLLQVALKFDRIMLIGGSGSGKTSLMQHFVANKNGEIIVCDPDDDKSTWPSNAVVIGGGEDFQSIENELVSFVAEKTSRYQLRANGQKEFQPIYLILDEWYKIIQNIEGGKYLKEMLVSLRKVQMGVLVISQSDRANALGLSGNFDLMSSFEAVVRLSGTAESGINATIDTGSGPIQVEHPGPFRQLVSGEPAYERSYEVKQAPMSDSDKIVGMWDSGEKRLTYIAEAVFGGSGGNQTDIIKTVLKKNSRL